MISAPLCFCRNFRHQDAFRYIAAGSSRSRRKDRFWQKSALLCVSSLHQAHGARRHALRVARAKPSPEPAASGARAALEALIERLGALKQAGAPGVCVFRRPRIERRALTDHIRKAHQWQDRESTDQQNVAGPFCAARSPLWPAWASLSPFPEVFRI